MGWKLDIPRRFPRQFERPIVSDPTSKAARRRAREAASRGPCGLGPEALDRQGSEAVDRQGLPRPRGGGAGHGLDDPEGDMTFEDEHVRVAEDAIGRRHGLDDPDGDMMFEDEYFEEAEAAPGEGAGEEVVARAAEEGPCPMQRLAPEEPVFEEPITGHRPGAMEAGDELYVLRRHP